MSAPARLGRRRFLALAGATTATVVAGGVLGACSDDTGPAPPPAATLPDAEAATRAVGERYLASNPEERDEAGLRAALPPELADAVPGRQVDVVARAVRADFEADRITEVDGWLLSLTECRLAALAVLG